MCCESCPVYDECVIEDRLKETCCKKCPDYKVCFGAPEEDHEDNAESDE